MYGAKSALCALFAPYKKKSSGAPAHVHTSTTRFYDDGNKTHSLILWKPQIALPRAQWLIQRGTFTHNQVR
ncbi:hypothetical protein KDK_39690 [Dictyobacter kobayashii]|uniref:Uncharacterized protein n=1 Tax=Dictyobacter kobayashii TaxID=2014872 RepID=A0A402AM99_9CHLR|nr:hypothetical protein KDK_39690 [Dictyobacter kobayashii]